LYPLLTCEAPRVLPRGDCDECVVGVLVCSSHVVHCGRPAFITCECGIPSCLPCTHWGCMCSGEEWVPRPDGYTGPVGIPDGREEVQPHTHTPTQAQARVLPLRSPRSHTHTRTQPHTPPTLVSPTLVTPLSHTHSTQTHTSVLSLPPFVIPTIIPTSPGVVPQSLSLLLLQVHPSHPRAPS
jgi:hypothetical protein